MVHLRTICDINFSGTSLNKRKWSVYMHNSRIEEISTSPYQLLLDVGIGLVTNVTDGKNDLNQPKQKILLLQVLQ